MKLIDLFDIDIGHITLPYPPAHIFPSLYPLVSFLVILCMRIGIWHKVQHSEVETDYPVTQPI